MTEDRAISLNAVIDDIEFYQINPQHFDFVNLIDDIKQLPPVTPQRPTGHWNLYHEGCYDESYVCSECDGDSPFDYRFCPNCGAKMIKTERR